MLRSRFREVREDKYVDRELKKDVIEWEDTEYYLSTLFTYILNLYQLFSQLSRIGILS